MNTARTARKVTSKDVARLAGVTHSTVSRVVTGAPMISEETRQRVLEAIHISGYRTQLAGRALVTRRHETFAMVTGGEVAWRTYASNFLLGVSEAVTELGYRMTIYATDALEQIEHVDDLPLFNSDSADGVILEHSAVTPAMEAAIACHHLPCVYINPAHACTHNAVLIDDVAVARTATQQLIEAGHRQIAYLPATTGLHGSQADRRKGYVLAMTAAGLAPLPGWELDLPADFTNGLEIGRRVRQWRQRNATAVVTYNTATMVPLLWTAANLSLRLPQELSVVCCGCDAIINMFPFTIAHVFINQVEMGRRAVRMLKERVDRLGADVPAETVPFHFTAGASLCPARTP